MATKRRSKRNYVNNRDFYDALVVYKKHLRECEDSGDERPVVPNYIAECFMDIATRYATKPNFSGYAFKNDMIMDAVENCLKNVDKFDDVKYDNPFAYFTRVVHNAFIKRISSEKKQLYIKFKASRSVTEVASQEDSDISENMSNIHNDGVEYIDDFIRDFESKMGGGGTSSQ